MFPFKECLHQTWTFKLKEYCKNYFFTNYFFSNWWKCILWGVFKFHDSIGKKWHLHFRVDPTEFEILHFDRSSNSRFSRPENNVNHLNRWPVFRSRCQIFLNPFNPYSPNVTFLYPLKNSENRRFSDVFRGYKNVTLGEYGLKPLFHYI